MILSFVFASPFLDDNEPVSVVPESRFFVGFFIDGAAELTGDRRVAFISTGGIDDLV